MSFQFLTGNRLSQFCISPPPQPENSGDAYGRWAWVPLPMNPSPQTKFRGDALDSEIIVGTDGVPYPPFSPDVSPRMAAVLAPGRCCTATPVRFRGEVIKVSKGAPRTFQGGGEFYSCIVASKVRKINFT